MSAWILIPAGVSLRGEFNQLSPNRDKGADGSIGDSNHTSSSDHTPDEDSSVLRDRDADDKNEVHAVDIDSSGPWPGTGTQKQRFHRIVMGIIEREKARWLDPNDVCRLEYVIWDGKIYSRSRDFRPVDYTGSDPHTNHAHFSFRYLTRSENDTSAWGIYTPPAPEKPKEWSDTVDEATFRDVVADEIDKALNQNRPPYQLTRLADRGNSPLTHKKLQEYLYEQLASPPARPATDAPAPDGTSLQARLERIERALETLLADRTQS